MFQDIERLKKISSQVARSRKYMQAKRIKDNEAKKLSKLYSI
jgi:hypothetical protein